jgi:MEDS: MEthanogen/methylotroph, DcmR Sensory domain
MASLKKFDHSVQLYDNDQILINSLIKYFKAGFDEGASCIFIASPEHRQMLEEQFKQMGVDLHLMETLGQYIAVDAKTTLSHFMEKGIPNPESFNQVIGSMIPYISKRPIRAYGEMVALLWNDGNKGAAVRLEEMWNDLGKIRDFSLFCAYPYQILEEDSAEAVSMINDVHSAMLA